MAIGSCQSIGTAIEEVERGEGILVRALGAERKDGWGPWSGPWQTEGWGTVSAGEKNVGALEGVASGKCGPVGGGASRRRWLVGAGPYRTWLPPWVAGAGRYQALGFFFAGGGGRL